MIRQIPAGATEGRITPTFDAGSVPKALLSDHLTTVWAELIVEVGFVEFTQDQPYYAATARPDDSVIIEPNTKHRISPSEDAIFRVQFWEEAS
jgi:tellurite resistance-related uncharacterized protein